MSRPKGSLNRKKPVVFKIKRPRGRPKNAKEEVIPVPSNVKTIKFLGHCSKCKGIIAKSDLESKKVYVCPGCGYRAKVNTLKRETKREVMSKKDYLNSTINAEHIDTLPMNDADHGNIKVQY